MPDQTMAFAVGAQASSFLARPASAQQAVCIRPAGARMALPNPFKNISNPFAGKPKAQGVAPSAFMEPQPGDPGYKEPKVAVEKEPEAAPEPSALSKMTDAADAAVGQMTEAADKAVDKMLDSKVAKLPVVNTAARGLSLLKEDLFKNAPEKAGVGRQDQAMYYKPQFGEPGYKKQAYEEVYGSELEKVIEFDEYASTEEKLAFVDNVKIAAKELKKGKKAKEIKAKMLNLEVKDAEPEVYDIPDYLKPIPEDTPRKGMTWKNYIGR